MNKFLKKLFFINLFLLVTLNNLQAKCIQAPPDNNWKSSRSNINLINTFINNNGSLLQTRQGIEKFSSNNENLIASTSGYGLNNVSIFDYSGNLKKNVLLDDGTKGKLIADVAISDDSIWWSSHRGSKIFRTSFNLDILEVIDLPVKYGKNIVGLTYVPEIKSIIFPTRTQKNKGFAVLKTSSGKGEKIHFFSTNTSFVDPYDIKYHNGCLFIVDRGAGKIFTADAKEIEKMKYNTIKKNVEKENQEDKIINTEVIIEGLTKPQHIDIIENKLFVIETKLNQISEFDMINYFHNIYPLNDKKNYRGLSILNKNLIALTGPKTGISIFELSKTSQNSNALEIKTKELEKKNLKLKQFEIRLADQSKTLRNLTENYSSLIENSVCDFPVKNLTQANLKIKIDSFKKTIEHSTIKNYLSLSEDTKINGIFFDPKNLNEDKNILRNLNVKNLLDKIVINGWVKRSHLVLIFKSLFQKKINSLAILN